MKNLFQSLRNLISRRHEENGYYDPEAAYGEEQSLGGDDAPQRYTALDIGTAYAKAIIIEVHEDRGIVLGVGRHQQSYAHMSDGIITDIPGVIANCNEALIKAEQVAGGVVAPSAVIGIAGELVKGSSITINRQRQHPTKDITPEELEALITSAQQKLLKSARERIAAETGYPNIEVRLTNAAVISARIDGQVVSNPIGFRGRHFTLTLFSAFAPLMQLGALETVAHGLDLTLVTIVAEPYALARCLSSNANADSGAIFIDIGGGTTDIALVRQGGIEETRMFALGGRTFTRRLATNKGISIKEAEKLKLAYSGGGMRGYIVGGGSALPDLREKLENFPWTERLPFARQPIIQTVQPGVVASIEDPNGLLKNAQDITPMALAYQAIELQNENNVLERALYRVIHNMHI